MLYFLFLYIGLILIASAQLFSPLANTNFTSLEYFGFSILNQNIFAFLGKVTDKTKNITTYSSRVLKLDINKPFETDKLPWEESEISKEVSLVYAPSCIVLESNTHDIICFGGRRIEEEQNASKDLVFYNSVSSNWSILKKSKESPSPRFGHTLTTLKSNSSFLFGGLHSINTTNSAEASVFASSDLWHLDGAETWQQINLADNKTVPNPRYFHTLTKISEHQLVLIGGIEKDSIASLKNIYLYDSVKNIWEIKESKNFPSQGFHSHSAVLWKNQIVISGGSDVESKSFNNNLYSLDLDTWNWTKIDVSGNIEGRYGHGAVLLENILLLFFGSTSSSHLSSQMIDLEAKKLVTSYKRLEKKPSDDIYEEISVSSSDHSKTIIIVMCIILFIAGIGLFLARRVHQSIDFAPLATAEDEDDIEFERYQNEEMPDSIKLQTNMSYDPQNDILYRPFSDY